MKHNRIELNNAFLVDAREGQFLVPKQDQYVGSSIIIYGEYNQEEADFLYTLIDKDSVVIEVGANIGSHTVGLAKRCKKLYAYEPQPGAFNYLAANIALNNLSNKVVLYNKAVGEIKGTIEVPLLDYSKPNNFGGLSLSKDFHQGRTIELVTLPTLPNITEEVKLLKVDVEGMEYQVLRGAYNLIMTYRPILYIENDRLDKSEQLIYHLIDELEYNLFWHLPNLYSKQNFFKKPDNGIGKYVSVNMLCLPAETKIEQYLELKRVKEFTEHPFK